MTGMGSRERSMGDTAKGSFEIGSHDDLVILLPLF